MRLVYTYITHRVSWASPSAAAAIHTAGEFMVIADASRTPDDFAAVLAEALAVVVPVALDALVVVALDVVSAAFAVSEPQVPERSGTPPTPVELVHMLPSRGLALELKVMSAHCATPVSSSAPEHLERR